MHSCVKVIAVERSQPLIELLTRLTCDHLKEYPRSAVARTVSRKFEASAAALDVPVKCWEEGALLELCIPALDVAATLAVLTTGRLVNKSFAPNLLRAFPAFPSFGVSLLVMVEAFAIEKYACLSVSKSL